MSNPKWLEKYLKMKPEVEKIFADLEAYHDWCRFNLEDFNPSNLYREHSNWGKFARYTGLIPRGQKPERNHGRNNWRRFHTR